MTRNELDEILHQCYSVEIFPEEAAELIWGQAFDGETERITGKDEREDCRTTRQRLKLAHNAIRIASDAFEAVNMWEEGECGSRDMNECLKDFLPIPVEIDTTKSISPTSPATEDSSATLSESLLDGTTFTRSYQVFLPTPTPTPTKPIFTTPSPTQPQPQATNSTASFDSKNVAKEIIVDNDLGCVRVIE